MTAMLIKGLTDCEHAFDFENVGAHVMREYVLFLCIYKFNIK